MKSPLTTLCYIEHDGCYLMMHRVCKENDENQDKWIGIGGHFEEGESPEECLLREAKEETGLTLRSFRFRGLVTFVSDLWGTEYMCLYTAELSGDSAKDADFAGKIPKMGQTMKKEPEKCAAEMGNPGLCDSEREESEEKGSGLCSSEREKSEKKSSGLCGSEAEKSEKRSSGLCGSETGESEEDGLETETSKAEKIEGLVTDEGILEWVPLSEIENLNLWEGDKIFLRLLAEDAPFFSLKLRYEGDVLKEAVLDGNPL